MTETVFDLQPNDDAAWRELSKYLAQNDTKAMRVVIAETGSKQRTPPQNRAIHKWFDMVAEFFNDLGLDMQAVLKPGTEIPWTRESVKSMIWHPVQVAMFPDAVDKDGKPSTAALEKAHVSQIEQVISRHIAQTQGVELPAFPDRWGA